LCLCAARRGESLVALDIIMDAVALATLHQLREHRLALVH
jgi:hypothetical protein